MGLRFTVGEMATLTGLSKQTLIYYDRAGVFTPAYTAPENHYRYYTVDQVEVLDSILILRDMGMSLAQIKVHMHNRDPATTTARLQAQQTIVRGQIARLSHVEKRIQKKIEGLEKAEEGRALPTFGHRPQKIFITKPVDGNGGIARLDIALKQLMKEALLQNLPLEYQPCGIVRLQDVQCGRVHCFALAALPLMESITGQKVHTCPAGLSAGVLHFGGYQQTGETYQILLHAIAQAGYVPTGDACEWYVTDILAASSPQDYRTQIQIPIARKEERQ